MINIPKMALTSARKWPRSGRGARNCHSPLTICIMTSTPSPVIRYAKRPLHPTVITAIIPIRRSCKLIKRAAYKISGVPEMPAGLQSDRCRRHYGEVKHLVPTRNVLRWVIPQDPWEVGDTENTHSLQFDLKAQTNKSIVIHKTKYLGNVLFDQNIGKR